MADVSCEPTEEVRAAAAVKHTDLKHHEERKKRWDIQHFIKETPCVRSSLLFGISCGLGCGFVVALYSKHIKKSCDTAVGTFVATSLGSWSYCYYAKRRQYQDMDAIVEALKKKNELQLEKKSTS